MKEIYVKNYIQHFKLHQSGNKFLNSRYEHVLSIVEGTVYYRANINEWKSCKTGDLLVSIINNIPLHG